MFTKTKRGPSESTDILIEGARVMFVSGQVIEAPGGGGHDAEVQRQALPIFPDHLQSRQAHVVRIAPCRCQLQTEAWSGFGSEARSGFSEDK